MLLKWYWHDSKSDRWVSLSWRTLGCTGRGSASPVPQMLLETCSSSGYWGSSVFLQGPSASTPLAGCWLTVSASSQEIVLQAVWWPQKDSADQESSSDCSHRRTRPSADTSRRVASHVLLPHTFGWPPTCWLAPSATSLRQEGRPRFFDSLHQVLW